jgi:hypothetical protein
MSTYKQFLASDINVTPFEVNKRFSFEGAAALTGSNVGIDRYLGKNINLIPFLSGSNPTTGEVSTQDQQLIYDSVKLLYYSNYLNNTASYGAQPSTASVSYGLDDTGDVLFGPTSSEGRYFNYLQTDLTFAKYFPTQSDSIIGVLSIPTGLYGNSVQPNTFNWISDSGSITDDGEGNLIFASTGQICGNIFYGHGIAVITSDSSPQGDTYGTARYGSSLYGVSDSVIVENFVTSSNVSCSFSSSITIYETQYKCTINENDFNFTSNPSVTSGSVANSSSIGTFYTPGQYLYSWATGSDFSPYVTTVGLYNNDKELLAIGKLSQPMPTSPTTDTTILINIDR